MKLMEFTFASALLATTACQAAASSDPAVSLQHLFTDKDCELVPELLGDWRNDDDLDGAWTIRKLGDTHYRLLQKANPSDSSIRPGFDICAAHLGGYLFFDATFQGITSDGKKTPFGEDDNPFWIPLHLIGRLELERDSVKFLLLDDNWLQDELKSGRLQLTCSQDDEGQFLLTAPSKELKQFATRFAADPRAFSHVEEFARAPGDAAQNMGSSNKPQFEAASACIARSNNHSTAQSVEHKVELFKGVA